MTAAPWRNKFISEIDVSKVNLDKPDINLAKSLVSEWVGNLVHEANHLFLDFETYYTKEYSLRKKDMTYIKYIGHEEFKVLSLSACRGRTGAMQFMTGEAEIKAYLERELAANPKTIIIGQNTMFDGMISTMHYGMRPAGFLDIMSMSKGTWPRATFHNMDAIAKRIWPDDNSKRKADDVAFMIGLREIPPGMLERVRKYNDKDTALTREIFYTLLDFGFPANELPTIDLLLQWYCLPEFVADVELLEKTFETATVEQGHAIEEGLAYMRETANLPDHFWATIDDRDKTVYRTQKSFTDAYRAEFKMPPIKSRSEAQKFLTSNDKFAYILSKGYGITVPMKEATGVDEWGDPKETYALALGDPEFQEMMAEHRDMPALWEGRVMSKSNIARTRAESLLAMAAHCGGLLAMPVGYSNAHTHRFGGGQAVNPQNFQRNSPHRLSLTAPKNYKIHVRDSSNIEARINADFCEHDELLTVFRCCGDPYIETANRIFSRMLNKKEHVTERGIGKATFLGCSYRMGDARFRSYLNAGPLGMKPIFLEDIPELAVHANPYKYVIDVYRSANWPIRNMWSELDERIYDLANESLQPYKKKAVTFCTGRILLPSGLSLWYPGLSRNRKAKTEAQLKPGEKPKPTGWTFWTDEIKFLHGGLLLENIIQALARCAIVDQMLLIHVILRALFDGRVILQVHDEVISSVHESKVEQADKWVEHIMCQAPDWAPDITLASEGGWDDKYSK